MTTTKVLVIVLVIAILLFVVLMVWGARRNGSPRPSGDPKMDAEDADKFSDGRPHLVLDAFNGVLGPFSPKLKASSLNPAVTTFDLGSKPSYKITVLSDDKHKFRQAKFVVQPMNPNQPLCAHVTYSAFDRKDENLRDQDSDKIKHKKPPNEFTLTILKGGGTLVVVRNPPVNPGSNIGPCTVELK